MITDLNAPKIFISYSWNPIQNKQKVIKLAERLTSDGVYVILDDWDLKEGQDKYSFMEQMVNNQEVKRVLLICNKEYSEKSNFKKGGVGIESLIVSDEIYTKVEQTKFIPIIFEFDNEGKPFFPTFVKTRIFIDLSNDDIFEDNYETLLRNIFDKPSSRRPPIGTIPSYLNSDEPIFLLTAHKVSTIKNALINEKKNTPLLIQDYFDTFIIALNGFLINEADINLENFDELILKSIDDLIVLRDDFIDFTETIITYSITIYFEKFHDFFEKLLEFISNNEFDYFSRSLSYLKGDNLRFFYYELFLTFSALLIDKEKFEEFAYILKTPFIIEHKESREVKELSFVKFRYIVETLNTHVNKKHNPKRVSVTADKIKQRATEKIKFEKLIDTDILLYYISLLLYPNKDLYFNYWFPETSCYNSFTATNLPKIVSQKYFNKIKCIFGVKNKEELIEKINRININNLDNIQRSYYSIPNIAYGLKVNEIGSLN